MISWRKIFSDLRIPGAPVPYVPDYAADLPSLRAILDGIHVRHCLVRPYQETKNYPVVESRELLPSFESDMFEYEELPGFSMVALGRPLDYFSEIFQFDKLHSLSDEEEGASCPLESHVADQNIQTLASRLPRAMEASLRLEFSESDVTELENYEALFPYLLNMDRAQVFSLGADRLFHLTGVFASFPSDIDSELKRFGIRIGKFVYGDSQLYERNRMFVYQYLMELYGFPIVSERRTSSALFARKLQRMGESFLLRVIGQSDRTLTTYTSTGDSRRYPRIDKTALVRVDADQTDALDLIGRKGFFLDEEKRVVIMRVTYRQHRFDPGNVRQDRALSVSSQEILHPLTGEPLAGLNIIKDSSNMFLRLNDIVRGEHTGRILYKRMEVVENTDTDEKRLKFLYTWLLKHQRRLISYSDDFFANVNKVILSYLQAPANAEAFDSLRDLFQEARSRLSYIQQARKARMLEDLSRRTVKGEKIGYRRMTREAAALLNELQFEIVNFFPDLLDATIERADAILRDRYLQKNYILAPENSLTASGQEIRKNYGRIVSLVDALKSVRKARLSSEGKQMEKTGS